MFGFHGKDGDCEEIRERVDIMCMKRLQKGRTKQLGNKALF